MNHSQDGQGLWFAAFIKAAQYFVGLTNQQDVWEHLGRFVVSHLPAKWSAFAERDAAGNITISHLTPSDCDSSRELRGEPVRRLIADILESGFLATEVIAGVEPSMTVLLPIVIERRPRKVMLVGHQGGEPIPKELLNIYLAVAGLAGTAFERLQHERELQQYRSHLEHLVEERTAELAALQRETDRQRDLLAVTLSSIGDGVIVTNPEGRITFLNGEAQRLTGWSNEDAQGRRLPEVFRIINDKTRAEVESPVDKVLRTGAVVGLANHTLLIARDGRETPIDDSGAPIRAADGTVRGVVLVFRDFSAQKAAEQALSESEQRVRRKLESILSPEGDIGNLPLADIIDVPAIQAMMKEFHALARIPMAIIDLQGRVLVGAGWQEICTRFHRVHPETCRHCIESDTELTAGVPAGQFKLYRCKNHMWDIATPITVGGRHVGNLFSGQFFFEGEDVDREVFRAQARRYGFDEQQYMAALERVPRLSREAVNSGMAFFMQLAHLLSMLSYSNLKLARSEEAIRRAKAAADTASEAKDQFIATLSHELRTPLTPALAAAGSMLQDHRLPQDVREDVELIHRNVGLEVALIGDLLDVTRIASGKLVLDKRPLDVSQIVRDAARISSVESAGRSQILTVETPGEPYPMEGDAVRLHQVFWNLVNNAVKFTPHGGRITVSCRREQEPESLAQGASWVVVEVSDSGVGIAPDVLPKLFNRFEQGDGGTTRQFGGLGLGLSIAKAVVEMHGGQITAQSQGKDKGATFVVRLPLAKGLVTVAKPDSAPSHLHLESGASRSLSILLVEDHADTAKLMARLLRAKGHAVTRAESVQNALDMLERGEFDLIVSDLGLPDGSGHDLMRQVRAAGRETPAIALSGYGTALDMDKSRAAGFSEHLVKPVEFAALHEAVSRVGRMARRACAHQKVEADRK